MATSDPFSPEIMNRLQQDGAFHKKGTKAVSEFEKFPGCDGDYYGALMSIKPNMHTKKNYIVIRARFMIIAFVENDSQEFAGRVVTLQYHLGDTKRSTKQENIDRMYINLYQALGCVTATWGSTRNVNEDLKLETLRLNNERPNVMLNIAENPDDKRYCNINIRDRITEQAISHLKRVTSTLSETELDKIEEASSQMLDEADDVQAEVSFKDKFAQAETMIRNVTEPTSLIAQITAAKLYDGSPADLIGKDAKFLQDLILRTYILKGGHDPVDFGLGVTSSPPSDTKASIIAEIAESLDEEDIEELEDILEEAKAAATSSRPSPEQVVAHIASQERRPIQLQIKKYNPTFGFMKSQEDSFLRQTLADFMNADPALTNASLVPF